MDKSKCLGNTGKSLPLILPKGFTTSTQIRDLYFIEILKVLMSCWIMPLTVNLPISGGRELLIRRWLRRSEPTNGWLLRLSEDINILRRLMYLVLGLFYGNLLLESRLTMELMDTWFLKRLLKKAWDLRFLRRKPQDHFWNWWRKPGMRILKKDLLLVKSFRIWRIWILEILLDNYIGFYILKQINLY